VSMQSSAHIHDAYRMFWVVAHCPISNDVLCCYIQYGSNPSFNASLWGFALPDHLKDGITHLSSLSHTIWGIIHVCRANGAGSI